MSFIKTSGFRGLQSNSDDIKIDTSGNVAFTNNNIVNKNLLINGGQNIWQRSTSTSVSTDTYSTVDRWRTRVGSMGVFTVSRSTDVPSGQGFSYSTKWDCTTADASPAANDYIIFEQRIEGQNLQHLLKGSSSSKKLTLSFWIKSNKTGTYIIEVQDIDNSRFISKSYTISSASTWQKVELTFDGDTAGVLDNDNDQSLNVLFWLGAGSTYTSGTLQTSWDSNTDANRAVGVVNLADSTSNELYITGCQLEVGENASGFEFEPYEKVLHKCQRYYDANTGQLLGAIAGTSTALQFGSARYTREMRATPTVVLYGNGTANRVRRGSNGTTVDVSGGTLGRNTKGLEFITKSSAFGSGAWYQAGYTADAEL